MGDLRRGGLLRIDRLSKVYSPRDGPVKALDEVSLDVEEGAFLAITGPSGAGKSTLLLAIGGLLRPTSGTIRFRDLALHAMSDAGLAAFRRVHVGFVMQAFSLIPYLTAAGNVALPMVLSGVPAKDRDERAQGLLAEVGLADRRNHLPRQLSAGQQQRVAIARAMANAPSLVLADEPTGNLDPSLARDVLGVLRGVNERRGTTIVMVTHSPEAAALCDARVRLDAGRISPDGAGAVRAPLAAAPGVRL